MHVERRKRHVLYGGDRSWLAQDACADRQCRLAPRFGLQDNPSHEFHDAARQRCDSLPSIALTDELHRDRAGLPAVVVQRGEKKPLVAQFGGIPLQRKQDAILVDRQPQFLMKTRSELLQRVLADTCELCGSTEQGEVHHIRKLADLEKPGRREKPVWVKQMATRRRKTLVVCRRCHEKIHTRKTTASFRKQGLESRMTQKWSSPVREKGNEKGP